MTSLMREEILSLPHAATNVLVAARDKLIEAGAAMDLRRPTMVGTIARGSSDHAATFLKYAIEITAGVPVASIGPSVTSVYGRRLNLENAAVWAISQSGKSPDIVQALAAASSGVTVAFTNTPDSPLARTAQYAIDLAAGTERSVAATKTFVASIVGGLGLLAEWTQDTALSTALQGVSGALERALGFDWSPLIAALDGHRSMYVLGRGPSLAIAAEAALKLKETCGIHAEAYSSAEVLHGPARIVESGFPVLVLAGTDAAQMPIAETADRLAEQGAMVFSTTPVADKATHLPFEDAGHDLVTALSLVAPFYLFVEALARHRGNDPDRPPHLRKVTETV
jgi:glucosamine--fructose-6-phosphate aminotransferase (isomerizing)